MREQMPLNLSSSRHVSSLSVDHLSHTVGYLKRAPDAIFLRLLLYILRTCDQTVLCVISLLLIFRLVPHKFRSSRDMINNCRLLCPACVCLSTLSSN